MSKDWDSKNFGEAAYLTAAVGSSWWTVGPVRGWN
jgi:hypothetical protein